MRQVFFAIIALLASVGAHAANEQVIAVWNGVAPGSENWAYTEENNISERDKTLNFRNIVTPTITVYRAIKPNGTGMLVIPGGGFVNLGYGWEGERVAQWLNGLGVTAFVLKYRLAKTGDDDAHDPVKQNARINAVIPMAVADAKQALHVVKTRATEWGLTSGRIGVIGFSAGGYLTWNTGLQSDPAGRPDFVVPVYAGAPQPFTVPSGAPPAFLVLADDDRYGTDGSLRIYKAWHDAHVPVEMHIYAKGNHAFALGKSGIPTDSWPERLKEWMAMMGFLPADAGPTASRAR
ncbi:MAG: alpha/beta hydrolase [Rhizomicrobium sp.]|nr:alpha/beta hydrolase [Rhizomicrobium sp.]